MSFNYYNKLYCKTQLSIGNYEKERGHFYTAKYSIEFKKKVVSFYKENGIRETLRVYTISNESIYKWLRKSESRDFMRKT